MLVCSVAVRLTRAGLAQATPAPLYAGQQRAPSDSPARPASPTPRKTSPRQPSSPHHTVVAVPPGAQAGQAISAVLPDGREIELHVPDGAQPGDEVEVDLDDFAAASELQGDGDVEWAAVRIQAVARGREVRRPPPLPGPSPPQSEEEGDGAER